MRKYRIFQRLLYLIGLLKKRLVPEKPIIREADQFNKSLARAEINGEWWHVDERGKPLYKRRFENVGPFSEGVAAAKYRKWWFYIGINGEPVNNKRFTYASSFKNGLARVKNEKLYSYIHRSDFKAISGQRFDYASSFKEGRALVRIAEHWFYINPQCRWAGDYDRTKVIREHFLKNGVALIEIRSAHSINGAENRIGRFRSDGCQIYVNIKDKYRPFTDLRDLAVISQSETKKILAVCVWDLRDPVNSRRLEICEGGKLPNGDYDLFMIYNQEEIDKLMS